MFRPSLAEPTMFRNPSVLGPTGTATDDMARFLAEPDWVLEPRKVDVIEIILTDEAFAIEACLFMEVEAFAVS